MYSILVGWHSTVCLGKMSLIKECDRGEKEEDIAKNLAFHKVDCLLFLAKVTFCGDFKSQVTG